MELIEANVFAAWRKFIPTLEDVTVITRLSIFGTGVQNGRPRRVGQGILQDLTLLCYP